MNKGTFSKTQLRSTIWRDKFINRNALANYEQDPTIPLLKHDETFGNKGTLVLSSAGHPLTIASSIVPTAKDSFWVTAYEEASSAADTPNYAAVARITADGKLDLSFGPEKNGFGQINFDDAHYTRLRSSHETSDGGLIVVGDLISLGGARFNKPMITRLLPSGIKDSSYGTQGVVDVREVINEIRTHVRAVPAIEYAVQADGGIFILASVQRQRGKLTKQDAFLFHITKEGSADLKFHGYGYVMFRKDGRSVDPIDIDVDTDSGRVLITCQYESVNMEIIPYLTCLTNEGELAQFGDSGYLDLSNDFETINSCTFSQDNSHIVVCGQQYSADYATAYAALANYKENGSPEIIFNYGDPVFVSLSENNNLSVFMSGQQLAAPLHTTTVRGEYGHSSDYKFHPVMARFLSNGLPDPSFGGERGIAAPHSGELFSYEKSSFTTNASGTLLIVGGSRGKASIFAYKDKF